MSFGKSIVDNYFFRPVLTLLVLVGLPFLFTDGPWHMYRPILQPETSANLSDIHYAVHTRPSPNCTKRKCVALTFDDGPNPESTDKIINVLEKQDVRASFFFIGRFIKGQERSVRRAYIDGDDIGNHSWDHAYFTKLKPNQIKAELAKTNQAIEAIGLPSPHLFRPPYGDFRLAMLKYIHVPVILWNVDPKDWAQSNPKVIVKIVEKQAKPGALIVMHDRKLTAEALDKIITNLKRKYRLVTVTELLGLTPKSQGAYVGLWWQQGLFNL